MAKQQSLKETDPQKYYKKKKRWLSLGKFLCTLLPALVVLIIYIIASCCNWKWTNPLNPMKFSLGVIALIVGIAVLVGHELRSITSANKKAKEGPDFTASIVWLYIAVVLWLFSMTMFYLIIFCSVEFVGSFCGAFCTSEIKKCNELSEKEQTAEINAKAMVRIQKQEEKKSLPVE